MYPYLPVTSHIFQVLTDLFHASAHASILASHIFQVLTDLFLASAHASILASHILQVLTDLFHASAHASILASHIFRVQADLLHVSADGYIHPYLSYSQVFTNCSMSAPEYPSLAIFTSHIFRFSLFFHVSTDVSIFISSIFLLLGDLFHDSAKEYLSLPQMFSHF